MPFTILSKQDLKLWFPLQVSEFLEFNEGACTNLATEPRIHRQGIDNAPTSIHFQERDGWRVTAFVLSEKFGDSQVSGVWLPRLELYNNTINYLTFRAMTSVHHFSLVILPHHLHRRSQCSQRRISPHLPIEQLHQRFWWGWFVHRLQQSPAPTKAVGSH